MVARACLKRERWPHKDLKAARSEKHMHQMWKKKRATRRYAGANENFYTIKQRGLMHDKSKSRKQPLSVALPVLTMRPYGWATQTHQP